MNEDGLKQERFGRVILHYPYIHPLNKILLLDEDKKYRERTASTVQEFATVICGYLRYWNILEEKKRDERLLSSQEEVKLKKFLEGYPLIPLKKEKTTLEEMYEDMVHLDLIYFIISLPSEYVVTLKNTPFLEITMILTYIRKVLLNRGMREEMHKYIIDSYLASREKGVEYGSPESKEITKRTAEDMLILNILYPNRERKFMNYEDIKESGRLAYSLLAKLKVWNKKEELNTLFNGMSNIYPAIVDLSSALYFWSARNIVVN